MQTETTVKGRSAPAAVDEELIDVLIAISVVAKRLASNLRQQNENQEEKENAEK